MFKIVIKPDVAIGIVLPSRIEVTAIRIPNEAKTKMAAPGDVAALVKNCAKRALQALAWRPVSSEVLLIFFRRFLGL